MSDEQDILAMYAEGDEIGEIATQLQMPRAAVSNVLARLCGYNRDRASELANGLEEPASAPEQAEPAPEQVAPKSNSTDLLDEAEATGDRYLVTRVHKVRALLDEIRDRIAEAREVQAARDEVARLEAELAAARARLKGGRAAPAAPTEPAAADGPAPKELRAWAAERGLHCSDRGVVPNHIREAWNAEQAEVAA